MKAFKVMRLAQQNIVCLGKVTQRDLAGTVLALGTRLVVFTAVQGDLRIGGVHRLGTDAAFVRRATATAKLLHAFLNTRHGGAFLLGLTAFAIDCKLCK